MFTGIVEAVGEIAHVEDARGARRLRVDTTAFPAALSPGDSVAVDGVCLTVERADANGFSATVVAETLSRTTLGDKVAGDRVNLERAATLARYFGGHLVQGHVDAVGRVESFDARAEVPVLSVELPEDVFALCVEKGSIAIDGVSLTIAACAWSRVSIAVVPHTLSASTVALYTPGRRVNVEADVIAKYVREFVRRG